MIRHLLNLHFVRFGLVAVAGLVVDMTVSWSLATFAGLPLTLAAAFGFLCGGLFNYVIHETWTFGRGTVSTRRGTLYAVTLAATLGVRIGCVAVLEGLLLPGPENRLAVLALAVVASFMTNYGLSRFLVFRAATRLQQDTAP